MLWTLLKANLSLIQKAEVQDVHIFSDTMTDITSTGKNATVKQYTGVMETMDSNFRN